ncbi:hypothetical protein [Aquibacillus rhizosphaerae]|uniref:Uncharacterized protein n=1 Tax=Aquibacillus rhizosphaerae TaxID=3051431 RepID=A0ABT7L7H5_9BACI|nr:hypothetical protein [Aquibacillus sp. LR5S19]MDL4841768.1 hypothetical protein [Aquibacillus sp. LR5S19]
MMNPAWLFAIATVIGVFGILMAFKNLMKKVGNKLEQGQSVSTDSIKQELTKFFIHVAFAESVPIILIVFAFIQMESVTEEISIIIPLVIILLVESIALINVWAARRDIIGYEKQSNQARNSINSLCFIGIALLSAIPIISMVGLSIL